jgi:hypothetical protein
MDDKVIWICFDPINYPTARILYGDSDPNGDKDVYVPCVPVSELEKVQNELSALKTVMKFYEVDNASSHKIIENLKNELGVATKALVDIAGDVPYDDNPWDIARHALIYMGIR